MQAAQPLGGSRFAAMSGKFCGFRHKLSQPSVNSRRRCNVSSYTEPGSNNQPWCVITVDEVPKDEQKPETMAEERSDAALAKFLSNSPACQMAASTLKAGAEVAVNLTDVDGDWRIWNDPETGIVLAPGKAKDPDFELRVPPRAG